MKTRKIVAITILSLAIATPGLSQPTYNPTLSGVPSGNTAGGTYALPEGVDGGSNTAFGNSALGVNGDGWANTAVGLSAMRNNDEGWGNSCVGNGCLYSNTFGVKNTAVGMAALFANITGYANTSLGVDSMVKNNSGYRNTALGVQSLGGNTVGARNIAIGEAAGKKILTGNDNIMIGNQGANESNTIRIGTLSAHTKTYIAGIAGVPVSGSQVMIAPDGKLGILASSARYKRDIEDLRERSADIYKLRPVTFRYKDDTENRLQYGLIAEEVAKVYPELVTTGADGTIESVQYHALIPLLLNEVQRQQHELVELRAQNERLQATLAVQRRP